tara:strand:+ start:57 stop:413 length:357 start_codon:yes stop_codon:yes gene_type:complete
MADTNQHAINCTTPILLISIIVAVFVSLIWYCSTKNKQLLDKTTETFMSGAKLARVQPNNRSAFYAARSDGYGEPSEDYARSVEGFRVKDAWKSGRENLLGRRHAGPWIARKKYREKN